MTLGTAQGPGNKEALIYIPAGAEIIVLDSLDANPKQINRQVGSNGKANRWEFLRWMF